MKILATNCVHDARSVIATTIAYRDEDGSARFRLSGDEFDGVSLPAGIDLSAIGLKRYLSVLTTLLADVESRSREQQTISASEVGNLSDVLGPLT